MKPFQHSPFSLSNGLSKKFVSALFTPSVGISLCTIQDRVSCECHFEPWKLAFFHPLYFWPWQIFRLNTLPWGLKEHEKSLHLGFTLADFLPWWICIKAKSVETWMDVPLTRGKLNNLQIFNMHHERFAELQHSLYTDIRTMMLTYCSLAVSLQYANCFT